MTTIMTWGNSEGAKGRCDQKCHGATGCDCKFMCGCRYHGAARQPGGVEQAVRDTWEEAVQDAEQKAREKEASSVSGVSFVLETHASETEIEDDHFNRRPIQVHEDCKEES